MATVSLRGNPVQTTGNLPSIGSKAPDFHLVKQDLSNISLSDLAGKKVVINIFPSVDTATCATSVRKFNEKAASLKDVVVLCVSKDLPFAAKRFCAAEGLDNVITGSAFRDTSFEDAYGVKLLDSGLKGLMARSVVVLDAAGVVVHSELVSEITTEPDYEAALSRI
ncbi:MAG TPA: thiol peroxidase [Fibrobacteria bacterium]|nr:thiol peroxidase [Fibrobacteria bacterium]